MKNVLFLIFVLAISACTSSPPKEKTQEVTTSMSATEKTNSSLEEYMIEKNDTLMYIAFKLYGDYERWKELLIVNQNLDYEKLQIGEVIFYQPDPVPFVWEMKGTPHLIKKGETLGSIAWQYFRNTKRWREIYNNNLQMIKDPNLIFAGFTLYVPLKDKMAMDLSK